MERDILAKLRNHGSEYVISIIIIYFHTIFICELRRGSAYEYGPVCETRPRLSIFFSPNETTPLRTANTQRNTLNTVAKEMIVRIVCVVCWGQGVDEVWCMLRQFL